MEAPAILLLICSHEVWVKVTYDWFTACGDGYAYVDPVLLRLCLYSYAYMRYAIVKTGLKKGLIHQQTDQAS